MPTFQFCPRVARSLTRPAALPALTRSHSPASPFPRRLPVSPSPRRSPAFPSPRRSPASLSPRQRPLPLPSPLHLPHPTSTHPREVKKNQIFCPGDELLLHGGVYVGVPALDLEDGGVERRRSGGAPPPPLLSRPRADHFCSHGGPGRRSFQGGPGRRSSSSQGGPGRRPGRCSSQGGHRSRPLLRDRPDLLYKDFTTDQKVTLSTYAANGALADFIPGVVSSKAISRLATSKARRANYSLEDPIFLS